MGIKHDLEVALGYSGTFNDHAATDEVLTGEADQGADIVITHGGRDQSGGLTPATCNVVFKGWRFNPDNVSSDLHGLIRRNNPLRITVDGTHRFSGEVSAWTPGQTLGGDVQVPVRYVEVEAGGPLRRLQAGTDPLPSTLKTFYVDHASAPIAYWTMEHGALSDTALPTLGEGRIIWTNSRLEAAEVAPWLEPGVKITSGTTLSAEVFMSTSPTRWTVDFMRAVDEDAREFRFVVVGNTEDASGWRHDYRMAFDATTGQVELVFDYVGTGAPASLTLTTTTVDVFTGTTNHVRLNATQDGADEDWALVIDGTTIDSGTIASTTLQGVAFVAPVSLPGTGPSTAFSHIAVFEGAPPGITATIEAAFGYPNEHAGTRFVRLSGEQDVTDTVAGTAADTIPMGPQFQGTLAAQYQEIADTDGGLIADTVTSMGVTYKTGRDRYNQDPTLTLDYQAFEIAPPLQPVLDDKAIRNDVTATRREGAAFRVLDQDNIDTYGRYTSKPTVNVYSDLVVAASAGWELHVGTTSDTRFAQVTVDLDASPHLVDDVESTVVGSVIALANLPGALTPNTANLVVNGWTETIAPDRRKITFNCTSDAPFHIAEVEHEAYAFVGALDTIISGAHSNTDTTIAIQVGADGPWIYETDFDVVAAGERMTVTAMGAASGSYPNQSQTMTVVRSVNGVVKAQSNGEAVQLFNRAYIGL